jgi:hypothetical protein
MREERLELSQVSPLEPKSSASANSATLAYNNDPRLAYTFDLNVFIYCGIIPHFLKTSQRLTHN